MLIVYLILVIQIILIIRMINRVYFSEENIKKLIEAYCDIGEKYNTTLLALTTRQFKEPKSAEFALHGFTRRIKTMKRCIDNIYEICPPNIERKPSWEELSDIVINLQSFILNVYGALDNLAWVWATEKRILNKKDMPLLNTQIGFSSKYNYIRESFSPAFKDYLNTLDKWFSHIEEFRHSLAHRIPLYVPPYTLSKEEIKRDQEIGKLKIIALRKHKFDEYERLDAEQEALGKFTPWMTHSFSEKSPQAVFHAQIIADWNTVIEIAKHFLEELDK